MRIYDLKRNDLQGALRAYREGATAPDQVNWLIRLQDDPAPLIKAMQESRADYDEDQPRDENGQWTSGGGGGGSDEQGRFGSGGGGEHTTLEKEFLKHFAHAKSDKEVMAKLGVKDRDTLLQIAQGIRDKAGLTAIDSLRAYARKHVRQDYDEDQPRDEQGRWSSEGGGGGADKAERALTGAGPARRASKEPSPGLKNIASRMKEQYKHLGAGKLPEDHKQYFKDHPDAKTVPVSKLKFKANKTDPSKGKAEEHMARALLGGKKREPLLVSENPDGTYEVLNGNHTALVAKEQGWKDLPVRVVDRPSVPPNYYTKEQSENMKASGKVRLQKLNDDGHLDLTAKEHMKIAEETLAKHEAGLQPAMTRFAETVGGRGVEIEGRTKDPGSALEKVAKKAEDALKEGKRIKYKSVADLQDGTGMRAVLPIVKGDNIAIQKAKAAELEKRFQIVAKDNYVDSPQKGGYRALHYIVRDKDGLEKEVQLQTRRQQNFQHWSHDVYKPVNDSQRAALETHGEKIKAYADKVSNYLYAKDLGENPSDHPGDLPAEVVEAFGTPRLDTARNVVTLTM